MVQIWIQTLTISLYWPIKVATTLFALASKSYLDFILCFFSAWEVLPASPITTSRESSMLRSKLGAKTIERFSADILFLSCWSETLFRNSQSLISSNIFACGKSSMTLLFQTLWAVLQTSKETHIERKGPTQTLTKEGMKASGGRDATAMNASEEKVDISFWESTYRRVRRWVMVLEALERRSAKGRWGKEK